MSDFAEASAFAPAARASIARICPSTCWSCRTCCAKACPG